MASEICFVFVMDHPMDSVTIVVPEEIDMGSSQERTVSTESLGNGCHKAKISVTNPDAWTVTGSFGLYTKDATDDQLVDVNLHFGTIAFGAEVTTFAAAEVKWYQTVVDLDETEATDYSYHDFKNGRWNNNGNTTTLEFRMKLSQGLREHDYLKLKMVSGFTDISSVDNCRSVLLGETVFDKWSGEETGWKENKFTGINAMMTTDTQYQQYLVDFQVYNDSKNIVIYGLTNNLDVEGGNANDTHVAIRCDNFKNPSTNLKADAFEFQLTTYRYTYDGGPQYLLDRSTVNIDEDMEDFELDGGSGGSGGSGTTTTVETLKSAECSFSNVYSGYFATEVVNEVEYYLLPKDLLIFVDLTINTKLQTHSSILIELEGLSKPASSDPGAASNLDPYVVDAENKTVGDSCAWVEGDDTQIKCTTTKKSLVVRIQAKVVGTGCFKKVSTLTSADAEIEKREDGWEGVSMKASEGSGQTVWLWGNSNVDLSIHDSTAVSNVGGIAAELRWTHGSTVARKDSAKQKFRVTLHSEGEDGAYWKYSTDSASTYVSKLDLESDSTASKATIESVSEGIEGSGFFEFSIQNPTSWTTVWVN
jgi:hypothetical protein